jgi:Holliday junction DNA helicase RuvA
MIRFIEGVLQHVKPGEAWIEAGGVGYQVFIPLPVLGALQQKEGQRVRLYTSFVIRENMQALYGFLEPQGFMLFELLIGLNGIGPSLALAILSHLDVPDLMNAVQDENQAALTQINGIGAKKADKILFELKGRSKKLEALAGDAPQKNSVREKKMDAVLALHENLGFDIKKSEHAVEQVLKDDPDTPLEQLIRKALPIAGK